MKIPEITYPEEQALDLEKFKEMDYYAVENYSLPIELMMENAGLQLANLVASISDPSQSIKIGVGNGNNGGGGLVAARRLASWGYEVYLDVFTEITKALPSAQLERALKFGAKTDAIESPDIWIDAYLGFSQRLPLQPGLLEILEQANKSSALRISLDIPTGFLGDENSPHFKADKIITLAAPKKILYQLDKSVELFVADIGIPKEVYVQFGAQTLLFQKANLLKLLR